MKFGIDVTTNDAQRLIVRLSRLKSTINVEHGGVYHQEPGYCQVHLTTTWTHSDLDDWLYGTSGIDYVGSYSLEERKVA